MNDADIVDPFHISNGPCKFDSPVYDPRREIELSCCILEKIFRFVVKWDELVDVLGGNLRIGENSQRSESLLLNLPCSKNFFSDGF